MNQHCIMLFNYFVFIKISGPRLCSYQIWHHDKNVAFPIHFQWDPLYYSSNGHQHIWQQPSDASAPEVEPSSAFWQITCPGNLISKLLDLNCYIFVFFCFFMWEPPQHNHHNMWVSMSSDFRSQSFVFIWFTEKGGFFCLEWQHIRTRINK